jgi:hypothetical protein
MDLLTQLQREVPDTDKDRSHRQARTGMSFGRLLVGALAGATAMFLLDPVRGAGRRAQVAHALGLRNDIAGTAGGRAEGLQNAPKGVAVEHGVGDSDENSPARARKSRRVVDAAEAAGAEMAGAAQTS